MSRFSFEDSEKYGSQKNSFFSLKDDGDTAVIRFLLNDINDLMGVATHEIEVNGKKMDVECLRAYNEPVDNCPLCAAQYRVNPKLYIPVYDETAKESKIWTRGKTFFNKMSSLCSRYNPLVSTPFEIERIGKKGDTSTTYETYAGVTDTARIEDFPEISAEGLTFQVKTFEDLQYYLQNNTFPEDAENTRASQRQPMQTRQPARRETPAQPFRRRPTTQSNPAPVNDEDTF